MNSYIAQIKEMEKVAMKTEKQRARQWGNIGALIGATPGLSQAAGSIIAEPSWLKYPGLLGLGTVVNTAPGAAMGYGAGRLIHRMVHGKATDKEIEPKRKHASNLLKGGLGDKTNPSKLPKKQLKMGLKTEKEHTKNPAVAKEIATDHLTEDKHYYTKLKKMEKQARADAFFDEVDKIASTEGDIAQGLMDRTWAKKKAEKQTKSIVLKKTAANWAALRNTAVPLAGKAISGVMRQPGWVAPAVGAGLGATRWVATRNDDPNKKKGLGSLAANMVGGAGLATAGHELGKRGIWKAYTSSNPAVSNFTRDAVRSSMVSPVAGQGWTLKQSSAKLKVGSISSIIRRTKKEKSKKTEDKNEPKFTWVERHPVAATGGALALATAGGVGAYLLGKKIQNKGLEKLAPFQDYIDKIKSQDFDEASKLNNLASLVKGHGSPATPHLSDTHIRRIPKDVMLSLLGGKSVPFKDTIPKRPWNPGVAGTGGVIRHIQADKITDKLMKLRRK